MHISTFEAICSSCQQTFHIPQLTNAAYGVFLYFSTDGQTVGYIEAIDHPVWNRVEKIQQLSVPEVGEMIRRVIGRLADVPSKNEYFVTNIICLHCGAIVQQVDTNNKVDALEIKPLQFQYFNALTDDEQQGRIQSILDTYCK